VDVIVGVRGETAELFEASCEFIDTLDISQLHVFTYSERAGTKMLDIEQNTPISERKKRSEILHLLSDKKIQKFYESHILKTYPVLWESRQHGDKLVGFTNNYIKVERLYDKSKVNTVEMVQLGNWNEEKSALTVLN
jgi:threonylcarbamoyladenosine tRNA methylthiotransferase MtaB